METNLDHAVLVARAPNSAWLQGYAASHRGLRRAMQGDLEGAHLDYEESLAVATASCNEVLSAQAIKQLAISGRATRSERPRRAR